jgi:hypothetical protein
MDIKSVFNSSFEQIDTVCLAISRPDIDRDQQHTGLLYFDGDCVNFLHLAWHETLQQEPPDKSYLWLDIPLDPLNKMHFATYCAMVYDNNKEGIPYGLSLGGSDFSVDGNFIQKEPHVGLTCATFVLRVFHAQGFNIVDFEKWPSKEGDKKWQLKIIGILKKHVSSEYFNSQYDKILSGVARFKPEEVVVAGTLENPPFGSEEIKRHTSDLLKSVISHTNKIKT